MLFYHIAGGKCVLVSQFHPIEGESTLRSNMMLLGTTGCHEKKVVQQHQEHHPSPQVSAEESPKMKDPQAHFWTQRHLVVLTVWGKGLNKEQR